MADFTESEGRKLTLNELSNALWAREVYISIPGQKGSHSFKGMAAACQQFGSYNVLGSCSNGDGSTSITVVIP